jgi:hypothetical protein
MTSYINCDFTNANRQPKQVTIGLFEANKIIAQTMAMKLEALLDKYNLWKKTLAYVKGQRSNLGAMTTALKFVVSCDNLRLEEPFQGTYFGHTMSKAC